MYPHCKLEKTQAGIKQSGAREAFFGHRFEATDRPEDSEEGSFARWSVDGNRLTAQVDRLGLYPLFYHQTPDRVMVSTSPIELLAAGAPADVDERALSLFMHIGWYVGEDTPFKHIRAMPPGGLLTWDDGKFTLQSKKPAWKLANITWDEAVEKYIHVFRTAVQRRLRYCSERFIVPLSGGRDSRHIALELAEQKVLPDAFVTYNYNLGGIDADTRCAAGVAAAVGTKHIILPGTDAPFRDQLRVLGLTHLCADEHIQSIAMRDYCRAQGHQTLWDGLAGGVVSRKAAPQQKKQLRLAAAADWKGLAATMMEGHLMCLGSDARLDELLDFGPWKGRISYEMALDRAEEALREVADFPEPYTAFVFWTRGRRELALSPFGMLGNVPNVLCPYMDHDVIEFLGSLPSQLTASGPFHDEVIAKAFPHAKDLPYAGKEKQGYRRKGAVWYARAISEAVAALARLEGASAVPREVMAHAMLPLRPRARHLLPHRYYLKCLRLFQHPENASRFLRLIESLDGANPP